MNYEKDILELLAKAERLKINGDYDNSIKILHKVILKEYDCYEAYEELGDNYLSLRELDKSKEVLKRALEINSKSANAHYLLGFLYSIEQKWVSSVEELKIADSFFPNHPEILRCLGWSLYNETRKKQGIAILERSEILNPSDPNILCDLGVCYMNDSSFKKAEKIFKKVIRLYPNSSQAKECKTFLKLLLPHEKAVF